MMHLAVYLQDATGAVAAASAQGWRAANRLHRAPVGPLAGTQVLYLFGPNGELVEILQPAS